MTRLTLRAAALLLDMDGTLVHSTDEVETVWRLWCRRHQLAPEPVLAMCHGLRSREVIRALAPQLDMAQEVALLDELEIHHTGRGEAIMGSRALLSRLPAERWALVTSASQRVARHRLESAGLPLPTLLVGAEDVVHGKPDPEPYLLGAERLGVAPANCLVFEDAPAGIQSALRAGCAVVQVGGKRLLDPAVIAVIQDWRQVSVEVDEKGMLQVGLLT
ncbi:HAD-IA family hydrolase [Aeromonas salmonicida]|uniref:Phosphatase n=2 Tax=Aeromonas salmonicida subsp. salmonicida TaxID=29491 RepID=A0ABN0DYD7_AERSS|nr:HAD-IA family hydrolase [Aeromonas salmonicida]ABO89202.1 putative phosphatase [Aeromonas salmonicida subsp. salmonicida A449]ASI24371.1 haloacid dehalogenase [Aeromonas salmonicida]ASI28690.1 haloacid dehalogenase [Aeromonas salmonicida]ASI32820.1 haloacid dehalogenase [Aeromonas salmonicida]ATD40141.1 haloacid dehalogenase [Aeromonas salmonicida subsp. masoucida]